MSDSCYRVYNLESNIVEESTNIIFDEVKQNNELVINHDEDDDIVRINTQTQERHQDK